MDTYKCSMCGVHKPLSDFNKRVDRPRGHDYRCRDCHNQQKKECEAKTRAVRLARRKKAYAENAAELREKALRRYYNNHDQRKAAHRDYVARNHDKVSIYARERKAAKANATPGWADVKAITKLYYVARRLSVVTGIEHHVDHIVPLRSKLVCGLHTECNLRVISKDQNVAKGNRSWPDMP